MSGKLPIPTCFEKENIQTLYLDELNIVFTLAFRFVKPYCNFWTIIFVGELHFSIDMSFILVFLVIGTLCGFANSDKGGCGIESPSVAAKDSNKNSVSTVSETSTQSFDEQRMKCVQYLQSNLKEFMQSVHPPPSKVSY